MWECLKTYFRDARSLVSLLQVPATHVFIFTVLWESITNLLVCASLDRHFGLLVDLVCQTQLLPTMHQWSWKSPGLHWVRMLLQGCTAWEHSRIVSLLELEDHRWKRMMSFSWLCSQHHFFVFVLFCFLSKIKDKILGSITQYHLIKLLFWLQMCMWEIAAQNVLFHF